MIGWKCKQRKLFSLPVLIIRGLDYITKQLYNTFEDLILLNYAVVNFVVAQFIVLLTVLHQNIISSVIIAKGKHPFPFRTRQLSPSALMVLRG